MLIFSIVEAQFLDKENSYCSGGGKHVDVPTYPAGCTSRQVQKIVVIEDRQRVLIKICIRNSCCQYLHFCTR